MSRASELWYERLDELRQYREENGHCNAPRRQGPLGKWVSKQRYYYRKRQAGELTPLTNERVAALDAMGFQWVGTGTNNVSNDERWHERLWELRNYSEENGHCNVPRSQGPLGKWVAMQRRYYRKRQAGERTPLTNERVAALDAMGFQWVGTGTNNVSNDERWYERLSELREFREDTGHYNVPRNQGPLGRWAQTQRRNYRVRLAVGLSPNRPSTFSSRAA